MSRSLVVWHFIPALLNKIIHRLSKVNSSLKDLACDDICKSKHAYCIHLKPKAVSRHVVNVTRHLEASTKMEKTNHIQYEDEVVKDACCNKASSLRLLISSWYARRSLVLPSTNEAEGCTAK